MVFRCLPLQTLDRRARLAAIAAAAGLALVGCGSSSAHNKTGATGTATTQPSILWPAPSDAASAIKRANLPALSAEGTFVHYHLHLDIFLDGKPVIVAPYVGIDYVNQRISPVHTHDASGVIHIESPAQDSFTLGQFFTEWGVTLSDKCLQNYCNNATRNLVVEVNGVPFSGDPASIVLAKHQEIAISSAAPSSQPPLAASYTFRNGL